MSPKKNKFDAFPATGVADWLQAATAELQGADPLKRLTRDVQGLTVKPFYSHEDVPAGALRLPPAQGSFLGPRKWFNCPQLRVTDSSKANKQALEHLVNGADGIIFELAEGVDFNILLKNIDWTICSLNFLALNILPVPAQSLASYLKAFSGDASGAWYGPGGDVIPRRPGFKRFGHVMGHSQNPSNDIAELLAKVCDVPEKSFNEMMADAAACIELGTDFFLEIAKLRAIRQTWDRLLASRKAPAIPLYLHALSKAYHAEAYAPHGNMIRATTTAMAAILGGCDALTVASENEDLEMERRVARNTAILLREESRLSKVADPVAGSYFIDSLSGELAEQAWVKLQTLLP